MNLSINFRNIFLFSLLLIASCFVSVKVFSQKAVLILDTSSIRIGERVQLRLNATLPKSASVYWPAISDTLTASVEVASKLKLLLAKEHTGQIAKCSGQGYPYDIELMNGYQES